MKSVNQISIESGINKKTLFSRITSLEIYPTMEGKRFLLNMDQERQILTPSIHKPIRHSKKLIFEFHERYPGLDASDISNALGVSLREVELILNKEFLIIESKINKK